MYAVALEARCDDAMLYARGMLLMNTLEGWCSKSREEALNLRREIDRRERGVFQLQYIKFFQRVNQKN